MIEIGSEKRFFDFISGLNDKDKVALISHIDLDGISAAKVIDEVVDADSVKFLQYDEIDMNLVEQLKIDGYRKVIFTDLYMENEDVVREIGKFAEILILDHHPSDKDWNSERIVYIKSEEGYCATYLCYRLFRKLKDIENLDWLVAGACVADFCNLKNKEWMEEIFDKYNQEKGDYRDKLGFDYDDIDKSKIYRLQWELSLAIIYFRNNLKKVFDEIGESFGDIGDLSDYSEKIQKEIDEALKKFEKEKKEISDGFIFTFSPNMRIGGIVSTIISSRNSNKKIILFMEKEKGYSLSARRQDKKVDMGEFVKNLLAGLEEAKGGGHIPAAGGYFLKKDFDEVMRRLGVGAEKSS